MGAAQDGEGKDWIEPTLGWSAEIVKQRPPLQEGLGAQRHPTRADRLVAVSAPARVSPPAQTVGGGADLRVAKPEPPTQ
jgi:hypothetical protein